MFKKTALTLLVSAIAMSACHAMEKENDKSHANKSGFLKTAKDKLFKKSKKEKNATKIEIVEMKPTNNTCIVCENSFSNEEELFQNSKASRDFESVKQKVRYEHFVMKEAGEKLFGTHGFPNEVRAKLAEYIYEVGNQSIFYSFPNEDRIKNFIDENMNGLLFKKSLCIVLLKMGFR